MSIEEDIKNLEKYIELVKDKNYCDCNELNVICYGKYADGSKNVANSIKNILQDYTRQKQINEEHKKINGELREKVKELEDKYILEKVAKEEVEELLEDSIPKQKIKDKLEEIKQDINNVKTRYPYILEHKIDVLQELLQEEDK